MPLARLAHFSHSRGERFNLLLPLCGGRLLSRNLLLLLRDNRLEFGDCALLFCDIPVLFQELIEQQLPTASYGGRGIYPRGKSCRVSRSKVTLFTYVVGWVGHCTRSHVELDLALKSKIKICRQATQSNSLSKLIP